MFCKREFIEIYGVDYDTEDGSCIRDFIHVSDLISGHVLAVEHLVKGGDSDTCNLDMKWFKCFRNSWKGKESFKSKLLQVVGRRDGDASRVVADSNKMKLNIIGNQNWII